MIESWFRVGIRWCVRNGRDFTLILGFLQPMISLYSSAVAAITFTSVKAF